MACCLTTPTNADFSLVRLVVHTWQQFHSECPSYYSLQRFWKWFFPKLLSHFPGVNELTLKCWSLTHMQHSHQCTCKCLGAPWCQAIGSTDLDSKPGCSNIGSISGPRFNIKMSSYQYKKSHCGDKTVVRSSYLHNGISYTGKMSS